LGVIKLSIDHLGNLTTTGYVITGSPLIVNDTYANWDTTSALQVNGAVNFNDSSFYGGINITSSGASIQIGSFAYATGYYSTALGSFAYATGDYSNELGYSAYATGNSSTALGSFAYAIGDYSTALGSFAYATGYYSTALGYGASAFGDYSTALGYGASAIYSNSTVIGSDQSFSRNLNDNNAIGGITLGGYNPTISSGENWLMIIPGTTANTPRVLIGASTVDDTTSALQVNGDTSITGTLGAGSGNFTGRSWTETPSTFSFNTAHFPIVPLSISGFDSFSNPIIDVTGVIRVPAGALLAFIDYTTGAVTDITGGTNQITEITYNTYGVDTSSLYLSGSIILAYGLGGVITFQDGSTQSTAATGGTLWQENYYAADIISPLNTSDRLFIDPTGSSVDDTTSTVQITGDVCVNNGLGNGAVKGFYLWALATNGTGDLTSVYDGFAYFNYDQGINECGFSTTSPDTTTDLPGMFFDFYNKYGSRNRPFEIAPITNNIMIGPIAAGSSHTDDGHTLQVFGSLALDNGTYHTSFVQGTQAANLSYTLPTGSTNGLLRNTGGTWSWDTTDYAAYSFGANNFSGTGNNTAGNFTAQSVLGTEKAPALTTPNWTLGTGWVYQTSPNRISKTGDGLGTITPAGTTNIVANKMYKIVIVVDSASGTFANARISLGGVDPNFNIGVGTNTRYIYATSTGKLILTPTNTDLRMVISSISIKPYDDGRVSAEYFTGTIGDSGGSDAFYYTLQTGYYFGAGWKYGGITAEFGGFDNLYTNNLSSSAAIISIYDPDPGTQSASEYWIVGDSRFPSNDASYRFAAGIFGYGFDITGGDLSYGVTMFQGALISGENEAYSSLGLAGVEGSLYYDNITDHTWKMKGALTIDSPINITAVETDITGSTSGHAYFSQPFQGATYKKVVIRCAALLGTASYTYPVAFSYTPVVMMTSGLATTKVTSLSTTACTVTGVTDTGYITIEGY
jgi:hypothetical protein